MAVVRVALVSGGAHSVVKDVGRRSRRRGTSSLFLLLGCRREVDGRDLVRRLVRRRHQKGVGRRRGGSPSLEKVGRSLLKGKEGREAKQRD